MGPGPGPTGTGGCIPLGTAGILLPGIPGGLPESSAPGPGQTAAASAAAGGRGRGESGLPAGFGAAPGAGAADRSADSPGIWPGCPSQVLGPVTASAGGVHRPVGDGGLRGGFPADGPPAGTELRPAGGTSGTVWAVKDLGRISPGWTEIRPLWSGKKTAFTQRKRNYEMYKILFDFL